ncbi:FAD-dependent oxidoreductase [Paenibacillus humicola]|uniref:FAD-dependent oxidoreductase n=1 Tax=Paenibacillus humicola TaxID=3110540 RepID=UPI00237BB670|nr:FAD-dependent oxidoreductase [Paenibacillus humicola]
MANEIRGDSIGGENGAAHAFDVVVYGGTSAGVIGAVQAVKMGKRVAIIEPSARLGGLTSGGLGDTDFGDKSAIGGLSREFYARLGRKYGQEEPVWMFEPKAALDVFGDFVKEYEIPVFYGERLDLAGSVTKTGNRIDSIRMESGMTFKAGVFLDTSYEGDLMAGAGVSYSLGREANAVYGERYNGIQTAAAVKNQLPAGIDPYVVPGRPSSGLLPGVNPDAGGNDGDGDSRIQAYCYRMCLTDAPGNRMPIERPDGYDERDFELLFRAIERGQSKFFKLRMLPNRKTDSNNDDGFSTDFLGMSDRYPEAGYKEREAIAQAHERYQRGLVWTLQHHPRVPEMLRAFYEPWGLPLDEFADNGHWTPQLYVRESRRMIGELVMTEHHVMSRETADDPVGMGSYTMDSHNVQRYVDVNGFVRNEGDIQIRTPCPYPVSYRSIVPRERECANLIVPVCLASSHIAYGSIRMEPVFMALAQSAATAAAMALEANIPVQRVDYGRLRRRLLADGQVLTAPC